MREVHEFRVWNRLKSSKSSISFHSARCQCSLHSESDWQLEERSTHTQTGHQTDVISGGRPF